MGSALGHRSFGGVEAAIAALGIAATAFLMLREDTEASLFGLAFLGLIAGRALGVPRRSLFLVAITISAVIPAVLLGGSGNSAVASTIAHLLVSGMLAWALSEPVWSRLLPPKRASATRALLTLVVAVLALGVCWEVAELVADAATGAGLSLGLADIAGDLAADAVGALAGSVAALRRGARGRRSETAPARA